MTARTLQIEERELGALTVGICDVCNERFRSYIQPLAQAKWEITVLFERHKCKARTVESIGRKT